MKYMLRYVWLKYAIPLLFLGAAILILGIAGQTSAAESSPSFTKLQTKYVADLEALAQWCEQNDLPEEAKQTRKIFAPRDPNKLYLPILSKEPLDAKKLPDDTPANLVEWNDRLSRLRHDYAQNVFDLAKRGVRNGHASQAYGLAMLAIEADPDCEPVRRLLGYQKFHDQWCTVYESKKLRAGYVWSDQFGWLAKNALRRYEDGMRLNAGSRWVTAAKDAETHHDINSGWEIETEHYTIQTDLSIEGAVALGEKLECLNRLWQILFIRYYASEAEVVALFEGRNTPSMVKMQRHQVVYYRDKNDYQHSLQSVLPNIDTIGFYLDRTRKAYFFFTPEGDDRTIYHEATHQLFHESRRVAPNVGANANFWIVEGIAIYMESLRREDGFYVFGGFDDERVYAGQYRLLHDHFYVPLKELCSFGMLKLQHHTKLPMLYSQSAGLTDFLVHYDHGRYRDALIRYLVEVYTGQDTPDSLAKLTGTSFAELDKQYLEFMQSGLPKQNADAEKSPDAK
jgi:hypothetical protein